MLKMQKKHLATAIALILTLTMVAALMTALPIASGQFLPNARETFAWASASPKLEGKGQPVFIVGWVYPPPSNTTDTYYNYTFTVTKPDGTTFTKLMNSSLEATAGFTYVPDQAGNYTVVLSFPGDLIRLNRVSAVSPPATFTITEEPQPRPDYTALPDYAWQYPISSVNQEWFRITGYWPKNYGNGYSGYTSDTPGPETAHILWKLPMAPAGLLGGDQGHATLVRPRWAPTGSVVGAMGRIYFTDPGYLSSDTSTYSGTNTTMAATQFDRVSTVYCIDQYSGKTLWKTELPYINYTTGRTVSAAQTGGGTLQIVALDIAKGVAAKVSGAAGQNNYGAFELWASGGGLWKLDPLTGNVIWYQLEPALSPLYFDGAWYINNYPERNLFSCINAVSDYVSGFPPDNLNDPGVLIWQKNVTETGIAMNALLEGYIVQLQSNGTSGQAKLNTWDAKTGNLVANGTYGGYYPSSGSNPCYGNGVYSRLGGDGRVYAWSFKTGSLAWVSEPGEMPWGTFGNYQGSAGYGLVMGHSYSHYMYAYNATTGALVWKQDTSIDNPYNFEYAQNGPPTWGYVVLADNKVYWASGEHTPSSPQQRGDMLYCNDVNTGELIFKLPYFKGERSFWGWGISCGMLWGWNQYDGCLYMFGKGETETTISVSQSPVVEGGSTVIQGHVIDKSSGTSTWAGISTLTERFPDGVPAVSDDGMSDWMAYLYTIGTTGPLVNLDNVKGVNVSLVALGSDGSTVGIGDVTADRDGHFSYMWSPPSKDCVYTVLASFDGSKSYYASYGETSVGVTAAPSTPTPETPTAAPDYNPIFAGIIAAVIAVIIIGIANLIVLQRRK